jgi:hypothetical protein
MYVRLHGSAVRRVSPGMALIQYRCVRPEHAQRSLHLTLTIHKHKWAFCTHEGPTLEHKWTPTGGVPLSELLRLRLTGAPRG